MSWALWTSFVPTVLVVCAVLAWWFTEPKTHHLNFIVAIGCFLFFWAVAPELAQQTPFWLYNVCLDVAAFFHLDFLVLYHANMLVTGAAILWLAHRAWQTLWKPVPELIDILGVDVPEEPDVSLAGIRPDAATLHWTRPRPNRPVRKFLIQVNGVNVGESGNQETAITVTGLKPNHFYNVRVIAVGYNSFQQPSRVIRLRTFARDGRPQLGNDRLPSNFEPEEQQISVPTDSVDEDGIVRSPAAGVEAASIPEGSNISTREANVNPTGPRRNTMTRKHSPSTTSMEQTLKNASSKVPEESLQELGEKFERIRKEIDETQASVTKDELEHKELVQELAEEKKTKRRLQKEKDDTTEKLRRELGSTDRAMRSTQQRKAQKEKLLRDKQAERSKLHEDVTKWEKDISQMRKREAGFDKEMETLREDGEQRLKELREDIALDQTNFGNEEAELKEKSKELKEAEEQRKCLPGGEESEEWRERDTQIRRGWDLRIRDLRRRIEDTRRKTQWQDQYGSVLQAQIAAAQQSGLPFMYNQANSSGVDFDVASSSQLKRRSRNSNSMSNVVIPSPIAAYSMVEQPHGSSGGFSSSRGPTIPGFVAPPFMDFNSDPPDVLDEDAFKMLTGGAPLSPSATALLPSGIFDQIDDEPPSPASRQARHGTIGSSMSPEKDPQSPASSGRSISIISSPHNSTQHLPFSQYTGENSERMSLKGSLADFDPTSSPIVPSAQTSSRLSFLPWRHRAARDLDEPPALGSLKHGQSQSFPRQTDEPEALSNKRRISLSSGWNVFNRNSAGPGLPDTSDPRSRLGGSSRLGILSGTPNAGSAIFSERDPGSPRPMSIASTDLPRPSTDSGSVWGRVPASNRLWSPEDPWSRNVSRRPSVHDSPSQAQMRTTLADEDDEVLDPDEIDRASLKQVGVIGAKPSSAKLLSQRLNPNAPTFMTSLFRTKNDKDARDIKDGKSKGKSKEKDAGKDRKGRDSITSASEAAETPSIDESPSESRKSRDAFSVHTPSVSESRESLSLDQSLSNLSSEPAIGLGLKEQQEGAIKKLLRKGSSSKFSLSSIRGVTARKGVNSANNSDKNFPTSADRTSFDEYAEDSGTSGGPGMGRGFDSVGSSPSIGPLGPGRPKDKGVGWAGRFSMKKKPGKEKDSLDLERDESTPIVSITAPPEDK